MLRLFTESIEIPYDFFVDSANMFSSGIVFFEIYRNLLFTTRRNRVKILSLTVK